MCAAAPLHSSVTRSKSANIRCTASDVLRWSGLPELVDSATDQIDFQMRHVQAGQALMVEGQLFQKLYLVSAGSFKCVRTDQEGYEQVLAFAIHGDIIGLDGLGRQQHNSGAIALDDAAVVSLPVQALRSMGRHTPALETLLYHAAGSEVSRRGETQYLMAAPSSEVRVARFLLQFARRQSALGCSDRRLRMSMTRREIASYLGVAHETVSRALTALAHDGYIKVLHRDIELLDPSALNDLQRVTRGHLVHTTRAERARQAASSLLVRVVERARHC